MRARELEAALRQRGDQGSVEALTEGGPGELELDDVAYQIAVFSEAIGLITRSMIARS